MTLEKMKAVLADCRVPWVNVEIHEAEEGYIYLQVRGMTPPGHGRKWLLSKYMVKSELVQTIFLAVQTYMEHELREYFQYKNQAIFSPHFSVDWLAEELATDFAENCKEVRV